MSFGREALRKTLKQLKENTIKHFESLNELKEFIVEQYGEMNTEWKQASENVKKARDKKEQHEAISKREKIRVILQKRSFTMEKEMSRSQSELIESFVSYVSALENYALEFDKTWDNLIEEMKKQEEKIEETKKQLKKENLGYIR